MTRILKSELVKLRTTRTALGFAAAGVLLVLLVVILGATAGHPKTLQDKKDVLGVGQGLSPLLLLFGVIGATAEYRHRTAAASALIRPSRLQLSFGRMIAYGFAGLAVGAILLAVAMVIGIPLLSGKPGPSLAGSDYAKIIGGTLLTCVLGAMLGVAVGVLVANQVAAVVGTLVFLFIAEPAITAATHTVGKFLVGEALATVAGAHGAHRLSFGGAVVVILIWTAAFLAVAGWVDARRDIA